MQSSVRKNFLAFFWLVAIVLIIFYSGFLQFSGSVFPKGELVISIYGWGYDIGLAWRAGNVMWSGSNPYIENPVMAYPPSYLPFCFFVATFPLMQARHLVAGLNFFLIFYLAFITYRYFLDVCRIKFNLSSIFVYLTTLSLIALNPFTLSALFQGQTPIWVCSSFLTAWYLLKIPTPRPILAGIFLGLATVKPHLILLPCIWLLLQKSWKALFTFAFVVIALMLPAFIKYGPIETVTTWLACLENYRVNPMDRIGSPKIIGLPNMLFFLGLPTFNMLPLGVVATLSFWFVRKRFDERSHLSILMLLTSLFIFMQNYDQVALIPCYLPLVLLFLRNSSSRIFILAFHLAFIMPSRFIALATGDSGAVPIYRGIITLLFLAWVLYLSYLPKNKEELSFKP